MNYATYYSKGLRVFLINVSQDRNDDLFEGFSATISSSTNQLLVLHFRYPLNKADQSIIRIGMQYKVTTESYGSGVQFIGTITGIDGSSCQIKPVGHIEMYQRSQMPRTDVIAPYRVFSRNAPLSLFYQEWQRFSESIINTSIPPLDLTEAQINLGMGGISYVAPPAEAHAELAMVFVSLGKDEPPICAVAELLWKRSLPEGEGVVVGRRFVVIRKADQERIKAVIQRKLKNDKKKKPEKTYWELLDRMKYPN